MHTFFILFAIFTLSLASTTSCELSSSGKFYNGASAENYLKAATLTCTFDVAPTFTNNLENSVIYYKKSDGSFALVTGEVELTRSFDLFVKYDVTDQTSISSINFGPDFTFSVVVTSSKSVTDAELASQLFKLNFEGLMHFALSATLSDEVVAKLLAIDDFYSYHYSVFGIMTDYSRLTKFFPSSTELATKLVLNFTTLDHIKVLYYLVKLSSGFNGYFSQSDRLILTDNDVAANLVAHYRRSDILSDVPFVNATVTTRYIQALVTNAAVVTNAYSSMVSKIFANYMSKDTLAAPETSVWSGYTASVRAIWAAGASASTTWVFDDDMRTLFKYVSARTKPALTMDFESWEILMQLEFDAYNIYEKLPCTMISGYSDIFNNFIDTFALIPTTTPISPGALTVAYKTSSVNQNRQAVLPTLYAAKSFSSNLLNEVFKVLLEYGKAGASETDKFTWFSSATTTTSTSLAGSNHLLQLLATDDKYATSKTSMLIGNFRIWACDYDQTQYANQGVLAVVKQACSCTGNKSPLSFSETAVICKESPAGHFAWKPEAGVAHSRLVASCPIGTWQPDEGATTCKVCKKDQICTVPSLTQAGWKYKFTFDPGCTSGLLSIGILAFIVIFIVVFVVVILRGAKRGIDPVRASSSRGGGGMGSVSLL